LAANNHPTGGNFPNFSLHQYREALKIERHHKRQQYREERRHLQDRAELLERLIQQAVKPLSSLPAQNNNSTQRQPTNQLALNPTTTTTSSSTLAQNQIMSNPNPQPVYHINFSNNKFVMNEYHRP